MDNPLMYNDPDGERVFVVTYTKGNQKGDEEFERVAETQAEAIRNSDGFDPVVDTVLVRSVETKDDFKRVIAEANKLDDVFGKVEQVTIVSHSGAADGPIFKGGGQFSKEELDSLKINWDRQSGKANGLFLGCNTANFCQTFANSQRVPAHGFDTFASFSASPTWKNKSYVATDYLYKSSLYLVANDGRAMIRREPQGKVHTLFRIPGPRPRL